MCKVVVKLEKKPGNFKLPQFLQGSLAERERTIGIKGSRRQRVKNGATFSSSP